MTKFINPEYIVLQGGIKDGEVLPVTKGVGWVEFYTSEGKVRYTRTKDFDNTRAVFRVEA